MTGSRRKFLGRLGAAALLAGVAGTAWVATSPRRSARNLRQLVRDAVRRVNAAPVRPQPSTWPAEGLTVCWLGHSTVLVDFGGLRVLTDPVFSRRVGIDVGIGTLGPKRYVAPALTCAQLPPIDVVVLSHAHMDHLDIPSLRGFPKGTFGVSARDTRDLLEGTPLRQATELGWGQSTVFRCARGEVAIRAFEVRHWGRRWPSEKDRGYNGYAITVGRRKVLFAGDTAFTTRFQEMRAHGPYDLAIMPIAAYNPWIRNHCTPEEAVRMADLAGAHRIVPVHHRTFKLSEERLEEPFERIQAALSRTPDRLAVREVGEALTIA